MNKFSPNTAKPSATALRGVVPRSSGSGSAKPLLVEIAWEACNQIGGIYTVLRSKASSMVDKWKDRYCLIGPYNAQTATVEFEPAPLLGPMGQAVKQMQTQGIEIHFGRWLVTSRPYVVLINQQGFFDNLHEIKYRLWQDHHIPLPTDDALLNNVVAFGEACKQLLMLLAESESPRRKIVAHFHEWMAATAVPMLRRDHWPGTIVFTTHATQLGRYLAMHDEHFYENLPHYDASHEAAKYLVEAQHGIERAATHGAHVFTTVSDITGQECRHLLERKPDLLLPNGINTQRITALHELQNLHRKFKEKIHEFTIGHFFPSYHFDLDHTLYFFTSGRFEYRNKGMDLTIDALAKLNHQLRATDSKKVVVAFIVTRQPVKSISAAALQSRAMLDEFRTAAETIGEDLGKKLFHAAAEGRIVDLNSVVDEYWLLRLRRAIHAWKRDLPPAIVTHDMINDEHDPVLNQLRTCGLFNQECDRVKVIYHPDFISPSSPLFGLEYEQFVRGCHLGLFPSYYEPWGYTPLESIALGVPAVTSDLSGFGSYFKQLLPHHEEMGMHVLNRRGRPLHDAAEALAHRMLRFCQLNRRQRIALRNTVESTSEHFDWSHLSKCYHEAHELAMDRVV